MLRALKRVWKEIKQNEIIKVLLFIAFLMPVFLWVFKLRFDVTRGTYDCKGSYDSNWLSFFGSYLGGLFGGVATLIAVVYTINNNKNEQNTKEENEKKKNIQNSALIVYYDFSFAFDNIKGFFAAYIKKCGIDSSLNSLKTGTVDFTQYSACLVEFDQFYFYSDWIRAVAVLNNSPLFGQSEIQTIYETYGLLMNVKRCVEMPSTITSKTAFLSINKLIDSCKLEENRKQYYIQEITKNEIRINKNISTILDNLEVVAFEKASESAT